MTTDRGPKLCTVRARRSDRLRPGQGRGDDRARASRRCSASCRPTRSSDEPEAPCAPPSRRRSSASPWTGRCAPTTRSCCRRRAPPGSALPRELLDAVLLQLALEIVADGEGASRVGRVEVAAAATPTRPSASRARSPTRRSSRRRCTAATPTGAGSPRRPGWRSPARSSRSWGPSHIDAAGLGADEREAELSLRLGRGDGARPRLLLRPDLRLRAPQRGVHDVSRTAARQRRDPARGAPLHPGVPRPHRRDQVRRRRDARRGPARGVRDRRRAAQVRRAQPDRRPRRRARHHRLHAASRDGGQVRRGPARLRRGDASRSRRWSCSARSTPTSCGGSTATASPRSGSRGEDGTLFEVSAGRQRRARSASWARSSASTSTSSTTSPRTSSR